MEKYVIQKDHLICQVNEFECIVTSERMKKEIS